MIYYTIYDDLAKTLYDIKSLGNLSEDQEKLLTGIFTNFDLQNMSNVIASRMTEGDFWDLMDSIKKINPEEKGLSEKAEAWLIELTAKQQKEPIKKHNQLIVSLGEKIGELQDANNALSEKLANFYNQANAQQQQTIREIFELLEQPNTNEFVGSKLNVAIAENIELIKELIDQANQSANTNLRQAATELLENNIFQAIDKINQQELAKTQSISATQGVRDRLPSRNEQENVPNLQQRNSLQKVLYEAVLKRRQEITKNDSDNSPSNSSWSRSNSVSSISDGDNKPLISPKTREAVLLEIKYNLLNDRYAKLAKQLGSTAETLFKANETTLVKLKNNKANPQLKKDLPPTSAVFLIFCSVSRIKR